MRSKLILGKEPWLTMAMEQWAQCDPELELVAVNVAVDANYCFDLTRLDAIDPVSHSGFVAWGPEFLNFQRLELMNELKKRGFKMPPLCSPNANISQSAKLMENAWIEPFSVIGPDVTIEMNVHVGSHVVIGQSCTVKKHAWIADAVRLSSDALVGSNAYVGPRTEVLSHVKIGRQAWIENTPRIDQNWPAYGFALHRSDLKGQIIDHTRPVKTEV